MEVYVYVRIFGMFVNNKLFALFIVYSWYVSILKKFVQMFNKWNLDLCYKVQICTLKEQKNTSYELFLMWQS